MKEWFNNMPEKDRALIFTQVGAIKNLPPAAIEKDWWAMLALRAIFTSKYHESLVFKGGTSLSKAWGLIERFSEDIDLGMDRSFFGFEENLTQTKVKKLRKKTLRFVIDTFQHHLSEVLSERGVKEFDVGTADFRDSDTDPLAIILKYKSLTEDVDYLKPNIIIEISARSLREPQENREVVSFIGEEFNDKDFADQPIAIPTVLPTRTLLEKIFLLHEEFQKPADREINSKRMTRHLYDISRIMDTEYLDAALKDQSLYDTIVIHRQMLTNISWVDYSKHDRKTIDFIPPATEMDKWRADYKSMQESMIYGESESFEDLIHKLKGLRERINNSEV